MIEEELPQLQGFEGKPALIPSSVESVRPYDSFELLTLENDSSKEFDVRSFEEVFRLLNEPSISPHLAWVPRSPDEVIKSLNDSSYRYVAKKNGHVVGTILHVPAGGPFTKHSLESLAVHPDFQHKGVASNIIDESIERGKIIAFEEYKKDTYKVETAVISGVPGWILPLVLFARRGFKYRTLLPEQMERNGKLENVIGLHLLPNDVDRRPSELDILTNLYAIVTVGENLYSEFNNFQKEIKELKIYCDKRLQEYSSSFARPSYL